ncbi:hypothetical protein CRUP_032993 [Coryphaenoides rupestris]|nr:hypothetical protein CRUP_032993 [Coryphaenoides rupestris]
MNNTRQPMSIPTTETMMVVMFHSRMEMLLFLDEPTNSTRSWNTLTDGSTLSLRITASQSCTEHCIYMDMALWQCNEQSGEEEAPRCRREGREQSGEAEAAVEAVAAAVRRDVGIKVQGETADRSSVPVRRNRNAFCRLDEDMASESTRRFTKNLLKPGSAAEIRQSASNAVRHSSSTSTTTTTTP